MARPTLQNADSRERAGVSRFVVKATTNLKALASSFVGRADDVLAIARRVEEERLVTILGPGGIGKTRLALRFAEERVEAYSAHGGGGVWFCDLSESRNASDIVSTVAATLGLELEAGSGVPIAERAGDAIARRGRILVVLDNFERIVAHAAETVGLWLRLAPSARFLVTSRVALDLMGEQLWSLSPLSRDDAIELFARRACQVRASFDAAAEQEAAGSIVDAIDRMPLAIELAASRMAILSTSQLRERLAPHRQEPGRGEVLAGRREVGRHASMRRTVLDSVALLEPGPRRSFIGCAFMRNGFTLEAAEAVFGDVLDDLDVLVRHSLLRVGIEPGSGARYSFFDLIRAVAEELAADEPPPPAERYVGFYAALTGSPRELAGDLENMIHARAFALSASLPDPAAALAITLTLEPVLSMRGQLGLCAGMLDEVMAAGAASVEAYLARGAARRELGESARARQDFEEALAIARKSAEPGLAAVALTRLGGMSDVAGDTAAARARLDEALGLLGAVPPGETRTRREAEAYLLLAHAHRREGTLDEARAAARLAVERYRTLGEHEGLGSALYELAVIDMFAGAHQEAFDRFDEGLRVAETSGLRVVTGALKTARGCLLQDLGRLDEALAHHAEAARVFREAGARHRHASALYYLASTYLERNEPLEVEAILREARTTLEGVGATRYEVLMDCCLATARARRGDLSGAAEALARAERAAALLDNEPALTVAVKLHRRAFEVRSSAAAAGLAEAEAMVAAHPSDDSRFSLRMLKVAACASTLTPPVTDALVVEPGGSAFRLPGATSSVELPARSPLRRLLEHLARRRIEAPGEVVTIETMIKVGWPGERIATDAALNRAYVALASLRKLGLKGFLLHGAGGYAISQAVVVRIAEQH